MSFLDNLENNLKALEGREQGGMDDHRRRDSERKEAVAAGPWADKLKRGSFASTLMQLSTRSGYAIRTKINLLWMNSTLRLEGRGHRLELRPTASGVVAVFLHNGEETGRENVDLDASPEALNQRFMAILSEQKAADDAAAAAAVISDDED